ncbi:hypothetical protein B0H14DRAFT_3443211 [Mycena olivaceomarginata]|nr:hypothetical protein B0H14DRAFT_3443211 [Mycena olivaceomarginata]
MTTQSRSTTTKNKDNTVPAAPPKVREKRQRSAATMAARRQASARYRERNLEEEREKGRERMARYTPARKLWSAQELAQEFRARARDASRWFRQKNGPNLAHRQRIIRLE